MSTERPQVVSVMASPAPAGEGKPFASRERRVGVRGWLLVLVVLAYACAFRGTRPLYSPDEGRYTNVARNMLDNGDWLIPMLHQKETPWAKPPLRYWSGPTSFAVSARHEFAAWLPGALAFAGTVL